MSVSVDPCDRNPLRRGGESIDCEFNLSNGLVDVGVDDALVDEVRIGPLERFAVARQSLEASVLHVAHRDTVQYIKYQYSIWQ